MGCEGEGKISVQTGVVTGLTCGSVLVDFFSRCLLGLLALWRLAGQPRGARQPKLGAARLGTAAP